MFRGALTFIAIRTIKAWINRGASPVPVALTAQRVRIDGRSRGFNGSHVIARRPLILSEFGVAERHFTAVSIRGA